MKVKPRHKLSQLRKWVFYPYLILFVLTISSCDFDIPDKFEMPVWYFDLKIPLVQTRYPMGDLSDSTNGIFITDDSLGFKIIQEGDMPATELPALPSIPLGLDQEVSSGEIEGINVDIDLPNLSIPIPIPLVRYGLEIYQDTAKWCIDTTIGNEPFSIDTTICVTDSETGDTLGRLFSFPTDSIRTMSKENYNQFIWFVFDSVMSVVSSKLDTIIDLGLSSIPLPEEPPIIASVDTLIIGTHPTNSVYRTYFKSNAPTNLQNIYSYMVAGDVNPLSDTLANHNEIPILSYGQIYADTTNLSGKGLTNNLNLATNFALVQATDYVTIPPGSLYVNFELTFQLAGIDSIDVTTNNYSLTDAIEMPDLTLPEMDMSESGITRMEIYRNILTNEGAAYNENKLKINNLESSFPFDMNFLLNFQNFFPIAGRPLVKIDTVLRKGVTIDSTFDLRGDTLQSISGNYDGDEWPDSAFTEFDLLLDIVIPEQKASIPLDGSPLGEFKMKMELNQLSFSSIGANLFMEMPVDSSEFDFPPGFSGAVPTEAMIELIFKNQIKLPIEMLLEFKGYTGGQLLAYLPVIVDTLGMPMTDSDLDTAVTVIGLNKDGTTITLYPTMEDYNSEDFIPWEKTTPPCDTCASIIDLLAINPENLIINPEIKVDGKGEIQPEKAIAGGFKVTIPLVLQIEPMAFLSGKPSPIDSLEHDTRYRIRNSLLETSLVSTITNAMPFGAEVSVLMSNDSLFPTDTSREQLNMFRDTLAAQGILAETDSLYITRKCSDLSPDSGNIYIYNTMTDFSECIDGLPYIIKANDFGADTIFFYVDTLFKFTLPNPEAYYGENDTTGYPEGMVAIPGTGIYYSTVDTSQIFLLTDHGEHFTETRFYLPGTDGRGAFLSVEDYLDISSYITFTLSSGGFGDAENELLLTYPNGGQRFSTSDTIAITWVSFGESDEKIDLYYSTGGDTNTYKSSYCLYTENWTLIASDLDNTLSYNWDLNSTSLSDTNSVRLKIIASNGEACDVNGHGITIIETSVSSVNRPFSPRNRKIIK